MKASELRVENWVLENDVPFQIDVSDLHLANIFEPILLTEVWMVMFGFVPDPESDTIGEYRYKHYVVSNQLNINVNPNVKAQTFGCCRLNGKPFADCHYVHQLQNLYFALTQQELPC